MCLGDKGCMEKQVNGDGGTFTLYRPIQVTQEVFQPWVDRSRVLLYLMGCYCSFTKFIGWLQLQIHWMAYNSKLYHYKQQKIEHYTTISQGSKDDFECSTSPNRAWCILSSAFIVISQIHKFYDYLKAQPPWLFYSFFCWSNIILLNHY